jgi:GNAT superfamily N-acetyltransferase
VRPSRRPSGSVVTDTSVTIVPGYRVGLIGRCLELQALYYGRHSGFGRLFETGRARDIAAFFDRDDEGRSEFWSAIASDTIVGTIAIDGSAADGTAQLRWFVVAEESQGMGVGRRLLATALAFCDAVAFTRVHLWTFAGLDAARRLYEASGFVLAEEYPGHQWGPEVLEQHFVRTYPRVSR